MTDMRIPEFQTVFSRLADYIEKRPRFGPFPLESAFTWSVLLAAQEANDVHGPMLEIGVQFGTTAFLMLDYLRPDEHATLIDLETTEEWIRGMEGPYRNCTNNSYIVGDSMKLSPNDIPSGCRWVHVDGGHSYECVASDLELVDSASSHDGITVFDDFFQVSWPDVTLAVVDHLRKSDNLVPFLLVDRKLYCARNSEFALLYRTVFGTFLLQNQENIGEVRHWKTVPMMGFPVSAAKIFPAGNLRALQP